MAGQGHNRWRTRGRNEDRCNLHAKYDSSPASVSGTGASYDTISMKQVNANTFTDERKQTGDRFRPAVAT
jgi:hypothetical protein